MDEAWGVLREAGLPEGPARTPPASPLDVERLRAALARVAAAPELLDPRRREPLAAWLCAFRHHWPSAFDRVLGPEARSLQERLAGVPADANRHLKLRRIAIANLSGLL